MPYIKTDILHNYIRDIFHAQGVPLKDASICADVLIDADLQGIDSHGINRLMMYYDRIQQGIYSPKTKITTLKESPTTATIDGNNGIGHVISHKAMSLAIQKAKKYGLGAVSVRNGTHFGIARYYAEMATKKHMIGLVFTNTRPSVAPFQGVEPLLGTNPIAAGFPTNEEFPFIIDMATSAIQRGKIELYARKNKTLEPGLVVNSEGLSEENPAQILQKFEAGEAASVPLGGMLAAYGGHKGYGLSVMVELLSCMLSDADYLKHTIHVDENGKKKLPLGHLFIAINVGSFISVKRAKEIAGNILQEIRSSKKMPGAKQIYTAGEMEYLTRKKREKKGIAVSASIMKEFSKMSKETGVPLPKRT